MFDTLRNNRQRSWQDLCTNLQQVHNKDWRTITAENGEIEGVKLDSVFYTFKVDHYYRGWMQLRVMHKVEDIWKPEIIVNHRQQELKKYRRSVEGDELNKAKDIARLVRKFERNGDDSMFVSAYSRNQTAQMVVAEIFTQVNADSIELSKRSDGITVRVFDSIHLNYINEGSSTRLGVYLYPKARKIEGFADRFELSNKLQQDAARFYQLGYDINFYKVEAGNSSVDGTIQMSRHNDIANFSEIYGHIKESEAGRLIIRNFMTKQMGKK